MTTYNRRDMPHPTLRPEQTNRDYEPHIAFNAQLAAIRRSAEACKRRRYIGPRGRRDC